ncbi:hypothetical protein BH10ACT7_BH10ACT7_04430 [soil metagenome]
MRFVGVVKQGMPASSESALGLAGQLRVLSDDRLAALLTAREVREQGIRDFFDLADALLDPESIQHALGRLDRPTLTTLASLIDGPTDAPREHLDTLERLALITTHQGSPAVPASVSAQLARWPALGLPSADALVSVPPPTTLAPVSATESRFTNGIASEHAFATTTSIAELIAELQHESARELARGGIALPDSKRLAAAMGVDIARVAELLEIASRAGLVALDSGRWMPTGSSDDWMVESSGERWARLAAAWLERLPADIRTILGERAHATWGDRLDEYVSWLFPAGGDWMRERVAVYTRDAELLGITADSVPSTPGAVLLTEGADAAAVAMDSLFPEVVDKVYLQHDLSIVSPGPLVTSIDARLRRMADVEGHALASTYRVSTASLNRAMASGETGETIRWFLASISLTGIPQPLAYLLTEAAGRYGLVRVGSLDDGRTYVRSDDATLLRTLLVDHGVTALGLARAGEHLESRFGIDVVFWALSEARYPVAAENAAREVIVLERPHATRPGTVTGIASTSKLIERLRLGSSDNQVDTDQAWLARQLDVAIRSKAALTVTVQLQDGSSIDYQLEPASVAGGRLRARDRRADIERTLPLSSITAVSPAQ